MPVLVAGGVEEVEAGEGSHVRGGSHVGGRGHVGPVCELRVANLTVRLRLLLLLTLFIE